MSRPIKVAFLTIDKREFLKNYEVENPSFGSAPEALLQGFADLKDIEIHVVSCHQQPVRTVHRIASNIYPHALYVPKRGWMRTLYQGCIRAVRRKVAELEPDIVHGQGTERDCALSAVFSGRPNILTIHGNMRRVAKVNHARPFSFHWLAARLEAFAVKRTNGIVCISGYTRHLVASENNRTWVVPNAVDESFLEVSCGEIEYPNLLVAGTICSHKNQNFLIRALDSLAAEERFKVLFVGEIQESDPYATEFRHLLLARPWCEYLGFADRPALKRLLSSATALVIPSLEDNCPMVVLEAAAAGVPAIGSRIGGIPELIDHSRSGLLVTSGDANALRDAVRQFVRHPEEAVRMGAVARERVLHLYTPAVVARRHLEIYREILQIPR